ncbi:peptide/nickel transport system permease protein [Lampropedia hyalina DSM 16112]|jgi:peptide/nickel transport system permease protein|uniref:Peptide/nickel transport system permease protein n=1 Tax=Lampropedia hyalina DSM 16112 TaxID=1122156 RepID=A0A1M4WY56_9BURK|nr:ABC transporter permease [Lampropedia hyalina]SHE86097.1 peptide/nickel transport system permease protein [Lampropedia hyalina DSM 16112]
MFSFVLKRLFTLGLGLLGVSLLVMLVLEVLPGNAAQVMLGPDADPDAVLALQAQLGLDVPWPWRYAQWLQGLAVGDLGISHAYDAPVADLLLERLALTIPLALLAMLLTVVLALAVGVFAALRHNRMGDVAAMGVAQLGMAVPNFWFAIVLVLVFSVQLQWFSAGGFPGWSAEMGGGFWPAWRALVLPAVALAVVQAAILARITRSAVLDEMRQDYVRTALSKGLSRRAVVYRHVLRNALVPVVTVAGLQFANLLAGAIVVENVFYLPGLGRLIFQAIANRDTVVIRNAVLLLAVMVMVVNFVVDLLYAWIDPRVKAI